jgi:hypothetical protein
MSGSSAYFKSELARWLAFFRRITGKPAFIAGFLLCAFPTGLMLAVLTPPGWAPDESHHLARAAGLLHGAVLGERKPINFANDPNEPGWVAGVKVDTGLWQVSVKNMTVINNQQVFTAQNLLAARAVPAGHDKVFVDISNTVTYFPAAYLPATLGLALGLAVHAPPYICFYLARLFMLAAFLTLGVLALWLTEYGEAALLTLLILPSTLLLAGSVSQDGVLIAMVCLACAALTRGTQGFRLLSLVLMTLFLAAKPPYILLLGVFLLPLSGPGFWRRVRDAALASVPVVLWMAVITVFVVVPFYQPPYHPGPLYAGAPGTPLYLTDPAANLHILLAQPARFITLPCATLVAQSGWLLRGVIGIPKLFEADFPGIYDWLWGACILAAFAGLPFSARPQLLAPRTAQLNFVFVSFLLLATYGLIYIMAYVDWTKVGADQIWGMQPRYVLPLAPFLLFAMPKFRCRFSLHPFVPAIPSILLGIADLGYLPVKLVLSYYLH